MKRNLTITLDQSQQNSNIIFINNIDSLVNHSCDSIEMSMLEYIEDKHHAILIKTLVDKLRPSGKLIIKISNAVSVAQNFASYQMSSKNFLAFFQNKQSILSLDLLYSMIDPNIVSIIETDITPTHITMILERITL